MQTQRNETGMKTRRQQNGHIAKIVQRAKESAIATALAVEDYRKTCEVETLAQAAKTCRMDINDRVDQLIAAHDAALALNKKGDVTAYKVGMESIANQMAPAVQNAEAALRATNDKLMRAGLEITAERWDMLAAGNPYRAHGCAHRLELIEAALGSAKPKKPRAKKAVVNYVEL